MTNITINKRPKKIDVNDSKRKANLIFLIKLFLFFSITISITAVISAPASEPKKNKSTLKSGLPLTFGIGLPNFDMATGAYNLTSVGDLYLNIRNKYVKSGPLDGVLTLLVDLPVLSTLQVVHHEYFGHLYRSKEFGGEGEMEIFPPFPYNLLSTKFLNKPAGLAKITKIKVYNKDVEILITAGGIESDLVASSLVKEKYILNYRTENLSLAHSFHRFGALYYILLHSDSGGSIGDGFTGDPFAYRESLTAKYGKNDALSVESIRFHALWLLADPLTLRSLPYIGRYIFDGKMFKFGKTYFMPGTNYYLTPYGEEFDLELSFLYGRKYFLFTPRIGNGVDNFFVGLGFRGRRLVKFKKLYLGANLDAWYLPKYNKGLKEKSMTVGGAIAGQIEYVLSKKMSIESEVGFKTIGFMPGRGFLEEIFFFGGMNYIL